MKTILLTISALLSVALCPAAVLEDARAGAEAGFAAAAAPPQRSPSARLAALEGMPKRDMTAAEKIAAVKALKAQLSREESAALVQDGMGGALYNGRGAAGEKCSIKLELKLRDKRRSDAADNIDVSVNVIGYPAGWPDAAAPDARLNEVLWGFSAATVPDDEKYEQVYSVSLAPQDIEIVQAMAVSYTRRVRIDLDAKGRLARMEVANYLLAVLTSSQSCAPNGPPSY